MGLAVYASRLLASWVLIGIVLTGSDLIVPATAATVSKKANVKAAKSGKAKGKAATAKPAKSTRKKPVAAQAKSSKKPVKATVAKKSGGKRRGGKAVASARRGGRRGTARAAQRTLAKATRPRWDARLPYNIHDVEVLSIAARHLGTPYRFGGASVHGFDCSGFTRTVFSEIGMDLPHSASAQFTMGAQVTRAELQPADLVFFRTYRRGASHVGIFVGDGLFIHANSRGGHVRVDSIDDSYFRPRYLGARRLRHAHS